MKRAFTLIEVLISITITMFIFVAIFNILKSLKATERVFLQKNDKKDLLVKTLYNDILNAKKISIVKSANPNLNRIYLKTTNSLYGFFEPYVLWVVYKKNLFRIESKNVINLPEDYRYFDRFLKDVKIFRIYKKENKYFVFIKDKDDIYFEFKGIR